jgi:hypothetical protein
MNRRLRPHNSIAVRTLHHIPQAALGFTARDEGAAVVMRQSQHVLTRTYFYNGAILAQTEAGLPFRSVLARDLWDLRQIDRSLFRQAAPQIIDYYRRSFPRLVSRL